MTTPRSTIVFNQSTGSDTAASGLGPATAVTGTAAAHTGGVSSTTITLTNSPDLSGVVSGDLLFINTASGRKFSVISSANNVAKTVTVDDSFNIASGSAVDYAIGGKRATLNAATSRQIGTDCGSEWEIVLEYTGSNYTLTTSTFTLAGGGWNLTGSGGQVTLEQQANDRHFQCSSVGGNHRAIFRNITFINTNATKTAAEAYRWHDGWDGYFYHCVFGSDTTGNRLNSAAIHNSGGSESRSVLFWNCMILNTVGQGVPTTNYAGYVTMHHCHVRDCGSNGIKIGNSAGGGINLYNTIIENCAGDGAYLDAASGSSLIAQNCTIHGNTGDGIDVSARQFRVVLFNNNLTGNGNYGFRGLTSAAFMDRHMVINDYNNYGTGATANTSGARSNLSAGPNDLAVDPGYVDAANSDFSVGTNLKAAGLPPASETIGANLSASHTYVDVGAIQRQEPTSGPLPGAIVIQNIGTY